MGNLGCRTLAVTKAAGWLIWNPAQLCRHIPQPGPKAPALAADVLAVEKAKVQDGACGGELCCTATMHVLDTARQECFVAVEVVVEAAVEGSGDWEKAEDVFVV